VIEHCHDWDGDAYEIDEPAAERLSADHPVAASLLLHSIFKWIMVTRISSNLGILRIQMPFHLPAPRSTPRSPKRWSSVPHPSWRSC
jgi:hypothetical protein